MAEYAVAEYAVVEYAVAEYEVHPGQYFTSDTRLVFLSGEHSLNTTLRIGNLTNLAMVGSGGEQMIYH